jgi:hypothetical protein
MPFHPRDMSSTGVGNPWRNSVMSSCSQEVATAVDFLPLPEDLRYNPSGVGRSGSHETTLDRLPEVIEVASVADTLHQGGCMQPWYDEEKETVMIELTEQQLQALEHAESIPPRIVNPRIREMFVLLRVDEYQRFKEDEYDDSPWTREEGHTLTWEAGKHAGWEDMDEYDDVAEKP